MIARDGGSRWSEDRTGRTLHRTKWHNGLYLLFVVFCSCVRLVYALVYALVFVRVCTGLYGFVRFIRFYTVFIQRSQLGGILVYYVCLVELDINFN